MTLALILLDVARQKGFRGIVAARGDAGLALAHRYRPDAITLDIQVEQTDGWRVLDRLKHDPATRHIPVHIISGGPTDLAAASLAVSLNRGHLDAAGQRRLHREGEVDLLLEAVYRVRGFDFRDYARVSLRRRIQNRLKAENLDTITGLLDKILHDPACA